MFLVTYEIIKNPKLWHFALLTVAFICAGYTHYYALMCGGLMILAIIIRSVMIKDKRLFLLSSASLLISILAYAPWIPYFFVQVTDATEDFWIPDVPTVFDCIFMFFGFNPVFLVFYFFLAVTVIFLLRRFNIIKKGDDFLSLFHSDGDRWWFILIGLFSIFGVILFMTVMSYVRHPVLLLRYLFTFSIIAWLIMGVFVSGAKPKKLLTVTILALTIVLSVPWCCGWMYLEYQHNAEITDTTSSVYPQMAEGDDIITDIWGFTQLESEYYYPGMPSVYVESLDKMDEPVNDHHWLFIRNELNQSDTDLLKDKGYDIEFVRKGMVPNDINVWIYRLHPTVP